MEKNMFINVLSTSDEISKNHIFRNSGLREEFKMTEGNIFQCAHCDAKFKKKPNLDNHMRKHTGELTCDVCQKAFSDSNYFMTHKRKHLGLESGDKLKKYICHICSAGFAKTCNLKKHVANHPPLEIGMEQMQLKMQAYDHRFRLMDKNGQKMKGFLCVICEKEFTRIGYLKVHLKGHLDGNKGPKPKFSCHFKLKAAQRSIEVDFTFIKLFIGCFLFSGGHCNNIARAGCKTEKPETLVPRH